MNTEDLAALNEQAWSLATREPAAAQTLAAQAAAQAEQTQHEPELAKALRTVGACELNQGKHREAREPLDRCVRLLHKLPDQELALAQAHRLLLRSYFLDRLHERALHHGHQGLEAARTAHDAQHEALALNDLGLVYAEMGAYGTGLEHLLNSLKLLEENETATGGSPLNNIGNIFMLQEQPGQALEFFTRAHGAFREEGKSREQIVALGNLGRANEALGELDEARRHHEGAVQLARATGDPVHLGPALTKLGSVQAKQSEPDLALSSLEEALNLFEHYPNSFRYETLLALAELRLTTGEPGQAIPLYRAVLENLQESESRGIMAEAHRGLSSALEGTADWRQALESHKVYHRLSTTLDRELFSSETQALLLQYKVEQSQREQALLRSKNRALEDAHQQLKELHAKLEQQAAELERISLEDPLTGLPNRRALEGQLNNELSRCARYGGTFSIIMCDIDGFKRINDRYSHDTGDEVLTEVGAILRRRVRQVDVPARIGGEEFLVLLPATPLSEAVAVAEQIRHQIQSYPWQNVRRDLRVTVSLGVAANDERHDRATLMREADAQLYRAKRTGKNRVCFR